MSVLGKHTYRIAVDFGNVGTQWIDYETNQLFCFPSGVDLKIQIGIRETKPPAIETFYDLTDVASMKLEIKPLKNGRSAPDADDAAYMPQTVVTLDATTVALNDWQAGTAQHVTFDYTDTDTALPIDTYWMVLSGVLTGGEVVSFGWAQMRVVQDGTGIESESTLSPILYYNRTEADALLDGKQDIVALGVADPAATGLPNLTLPGFNYPKFEHLGAICSQSDISFISSQFVALAGSIINVKNIPAANKFNASDSYYLVACTDHASAGSAVCVILVSSASTLEESIGTFTEHTVELFTDAADPETDSGGVAYAVQHETPVLMWDNENQEWMLMMHAYENQATTPEGVNELKYPTQSCNDFIGPNQSTLLYRSKTTPETGKWVDGYTPDYLHRGDLYSRSTHLIHNGYAQNPLKLAAKTWRVRSGLGFNDKHGGAIYISTDDRKTFNLYGEKIHSNRQWTDSDLSTWPTNHPDTSPTTAVHAPNYLTFDCHDFLWRGEWWGLVRAGIPQRESHFWYGGELRVALMRNDGRMAFGFKPIPVSDGNDIGGTKFDYYSGNFIYDNGTMYFFRWGNRRDTNTRECHLFKMTNPEGLYIPNEQ